MSHMIGLRVRWTALLESQNCEVHLTLLGMNAGCQVLSQNFDVFLCICSHGLEVIEAVLFCEQGACGV